MHYKICIYLTMSIMIVLKLKMQCAGKSNFQSFYFKNSTMLLTIKSLSYQKCQCSSSAYSIFIVALNDHHQHMTCHMAYEKWHVIWHEFTPKCFTKKKSHQTNLLTRKSPLPPPKSLPIGNSKHSNKIKKTSISIKYENIKLLWKLCIIQIILSSFCSNFIEIMNIFV